MEEKQTEVVCYVCNTKLYPINIICHNAMTVLNRSAHSMISDPAIGTTDDENSFSIPENATITSSDSITITPSDNYLTHNASSTVRFNSGEFDAVDKIEKEICASCRDEIADTLTNCIDDILATKAKEIAKQLRLDKQGFVELWKEKRNAKKTKDLY